MLFLVILALHPANDRLVVTQQSAQLLINAPINVENLFLYFELIGSSASLDNDRN